MENGFLKKALNHLIHQIIVNAKIRGKIKGNCLKISFNLRNEVNLFIVYELETSPFNQGLDFTLGICLFGGVKLTENADPDKYRYTEAATGGVL